MHIGHRLFAVVFGFCVASSAMAVQSIQPVANLAGTPFSGSGPISWTASVGVGGQLTIVGKYTSDFSANESGLGLKVTYDSTKFNPANVVVDNLMTKCMVATPQTDVAGQITFGWADTSIRPNVGSPTGAVGWPGTADPVAPGQPGGCLNPGSIVTTSAGFPVPTVPMFRIVLTAAAGFTVGQSTPITFTSTSVSQASNVGANPVAGAFLNQTLTVTAVAISFNQAVSRHTHTGVGDFDIPLVGGSLTSGTAITVEPRQMGAGHKIVFQFSGTVTSGTASSSTGSTSIAFSGNEAIVTLTGVGLDQTRVQVDVSNINGVGLNATAFVGLLVGDVNGSRLVNSTDILTVKAASGAVAGAGTFKTDLNTSGLTNSTDILTVKAASGHNIP